MSQAKGAVGIGGSATVPLSPLRLDPSNRRVRTRTHGGVGGGGRKADPYPHCQDVGGWICATLVLDRWVQMRREGLASDVPLPELTQPAAVSLNGHPIRPPRRRRRTKPPRRARRSFEVIAMHAGNREVAVCRLGHGFCVCEMNKSCRADVL
jgi:hypothetical protein